MPIKLYKTEKNPLVYRKGIFCFCTLLIIATGYGQAKMEFNETKFQFGAAKQGDLLVHEYSFTNTGNEPLLITNYEVACSCTSVDFPNHPILPKETEKIKVSFNTKTVWGRQDRIVELFSNDPGSPKKIRFKANVAR